MTKVGIIGTGMLGEAVGLHLLDLKYELIVYNRTKDKVENLVKHGAISVDTPKNVAERSDIIITVVKDASAVNEYNKSKFSKRNFTEIFRFRNLISRNSSYGWTKCSN